MDHIEKINSHDPNEILIELAKTRKLSEMKQKFGTNSRNIIKGISEENSNIFPFTQLSQEINKFGLVEKSYKSKFEIEEYCTTKTHIDYLEVDEISYNNRNYYRIKYNVKIKACNKIQLFADSLKFNRINKKTFQSQYDKIYIPYLRHKKSIVIIV